MKTHSRKWVAVDVAAEWFSIPQKTLYSLAARGRLPDGSIIKLGRAIRFNLAAIEDGLAKGQHSK
jgi:hypothetical protein